MPSQPYRVLLVEDDEDDYLLTRDVIESIEGATYELVWRDTFEKGLDALREDGFDVGLIDYRIGGQTGLDFLQAVKDAGIGIPMILLTGLRNAEVDRAASDAGAADYLEKGAITPALAERSIRFACANATAQRALGEQSALLQTTLDNTGSAIAAIDANGDMIACNQRLRELLGQLTALGKPGGAELLLADAPDGGRDPASVLADVLRFSGAGDGDSTELHAHKDRVLNLSTNKTAGGGSVIVIQDVTEQRQFEANLKQAKESAEAASRSKSAFLATMGHELRTPLNAVIGFSELMINAAHGALQPPVYAEYAATIHGSGRNLLEIINTILDFSKAEAGHYELDDEELALRSQFEFFLRALQPQAEASGVELTADLTHADFNVIADPTAFKRMVMNILSNALKFTDRGGRVVLAAKPHDDGALSIVVTDTGIGIADEHLERVFQPFYQVQSTADRNYEGTGLGLAIVKSMAELHGAHVQIDSTPGSGTSVALTFPPKRVEATGSACRGAA